MVVLLLPVTWPWRAMLDEFRKGNFQMLKDNAMHDWLLPDLACKGFEHANYRWMFNALLIHYAIEKFQLLAFIVKTLHLIPVVDFNHVFFICLHLKHLVETNTLSLWFAQCFAQYVWCWSLVLVAVRHIFRCCIEKSFTLKHNPLLNNCSYVIIIDFALRELQSADTALTNDFFGVWREIVRLLLIWAGLKQFVFEFDCVWQFPR